MSNETKPVASGTKVCSRCKTEKPLSEFYIHNDGSVSSYCKCCKREYQRNLQVAKTIEKRLKTEDETDTLEFLSKIAPRFLMKSLYLRGYRGELEYTEIRKVNIEKISQ